MNPLDPHICGGSGHLKLVAGTPFVDQGVSILVIGCSLHHVNRVTLVVGVVFPIPIPSHGSDAFMYLSASRFRCYLSGFGTRIVMLSLFAYSINSFPLYRNGS